MESSESFCITQQGKINSIIAAVATLEIQIYKKAVGTINLSISLDKSHLIFQLVVFYTRKASIMGSFCIAHQRKINSIIAAVAAFEIHIDKKAVGTMNPSISLDKWH